MSHEATNEFDEEPIERLEPTRPLRSTPAAPSGSGGQAVLLVLIGLAATGTGLALAIGPRFSWKAAQVMAGFDHLGVHGDALFMGGLVLVALGMLRRGQAQMMNAREGQSDDSLLIEQMASDVVQMRNAIDHMQLVSSSLQDAVRSLHHQVAQESERVAAIVAETGQQDAIYRMAASIDQIGGRLDQRLAEHFQKLEQHLEAMDERASRTQSVLDRLAEPGELHLMQPGSALKGTENNAPEDEPSYRLAEPPAQLGPDGYAESYAEESGPGASSPLGVLDTIDDPLPGPLPAQAEGEPAIDFDAMGSLSMEPDPYGPEADWNGAGAPPDPNALGPDPDTRSKLEQLESLLSDERLRAALEDMRRAGNPPPAGWPT